MLSFVPIIADTLADQRLDTSAWLVAVTSPGRLRLVGAEASH